MVSKDPMFVRVYDDKVETTNEDGQVFTTYWVKDAGIHPDHKYPCVMVDLLFEIAHAQDLGFDIIIVDERSANA